MKGFKEFMVMILCYFGLVFVLMKPLIVFRDAPIYLSEVQQLLFCGIGVFFFFVAFALLIKRVPRGVALVRLSLFGAKAFLRECDSWYLFFSATQTELKLPFSPRVNYFIIPLGKTKDSKPTDFSGFVKFSFYRNKKSLGLVGRLLGENGVDQSNLNAVLQSLIEKSLVARLNKRIECKTALCLKRIDEMFIAEAKADLIALYRSHGLCVEYASLQFDIKDTINDNR